MKTRSLHNATTFLLKCAVTLIFTGTTAQESNPEPQAAKKWSYFLDVYIMFPNMNGTSRVGQLPEVEVDANPGDIFDKLNMGAMVYFEAGHSDWAFTSDIIYMSLKQDLRTGPVVRSGEARAQQFMWELASMYRVLPWLEAGAGLRINNMDMEINLIQNTIGGGTQARSRWITETWVDPFLVARFKSDPGKKLVYQLRADIGGFGIGSDFAWQVQAYAGYRFSKLFQLTGGYRYIGMDYDKGSGNNRFKYDMDTFGPVLRLGFHF